MRAGRVGWSLNPPKHRLGAAALALSLLASSCGGGGLSLTEYAEAVEVITADMNREVDAANSMFEPTPTVPELVRDAFAMRGAARDLFVQELADLEPPDQAVTMHEAALDMVSELRDAELAMSALAAATPEADGAGMWRSPEAGALAEIDRRAVQFCELAQAEFDATAAREGFSGSTWMPRELKEVVDVAFRCTAEERAGGE